VHDAGADEAPPANPFLEQAENLRLGRTFKTRGAILLFLELDTKHQRALDAKVGLAGARTDVLPLPGPAGIWHVRVSNREKIPLLVPAGDTLLTPMQASRSTDRAVLIAPGSATFVPVVQNLGQGGAPPQGPYVCRGRGLTPVECQLIRSDRWVDRVHERNRRMGVAGTRRDDAAAAYATTAFRAIRSRYADKMGLMAKARGVVGVLVADDRGIHFAHLLPNHARFMDLWPALRDGILLDAAMVEAVGGSARPGDEGRLRKTARELLAVLTTPPLRRPTFGEGWEYRWALDDPPGTWDGLGHAEGPVCVTLYRDPPRPAGSPTPPGTGPSGPGETPTPGIAEGSRRARETEFERRLRERREGRSPSPASGGSTPAPPAVTPAPPAAPRPPAVRPTPPGQGSSQPRPGDSLPGRR
jgi:hypothetical protein